MPLLDRFYAILVPLRVECPTCHRLIQIRKGLYHTPSGTWDPYSQRLHCSKCGRTYVAGLLLWQAPAGSLRTTPPDTIASYEQLNEIRRRTGGFWAKQPVPGGGTVNRYLKVECTCGSAPWVPSCPVHGLEAEVQAEAGEEPAHEPGTARRRDRVWAGDHWKRRPPRKKEAKV